MVADSAPERLRPRWIQALALAVLAHPVLARPVDRNKNFLQIENLKR